MKHRTHIKDFLGYEFDHLIAGSGGKGYSKSILAKVNPLYRTVWFVVKCHDEIRLTTNVLETAVDYYNELP